MGLRVAGIHGDGFSKCGFRRRPVPVEPVTDRAQRGLRLGEIRARGERVRGRVPGLRRHRPAEAHRC